MAGESRKFTEPSLLTKQATAKGDCEAIRKAFAYTESAQLVPVYALASQGETQQDGSEQCNERSPGPHHVALGCGAPAEHVVEVARQPETVGHLY